jgi:hypothetical protein
MIETLEQLALAKKVQHQVTVRPDLHDQRTWTEPVLNGFGVCTTRRCIAGWTLHFAGFDLTQADYEQADNGIELVVMRPGSDDEEDWPASQVADEAGELLGLDPAEFADLFFDFDDNAAVAYLDKLIADAEERLHVATS